MNTQNSTTVQTILAEQFTQEVENFRRKVLVDFFAPWCAPCKMIAPVIEQIANNNKDIKVVKIDADTSQTLMTKFGIRGIPTLLLINDGAIVGTQVGASSVKQVQAFVHQ